MNKPISKLPKILTKKVLKGNKLWKYFVVNQWVTYRNILPIPPPIPTNNSVFTILNKFSFNHYIIN